MNLLMILYLVLVSPPVETEKRDAITPTLTSNKVVKPTSKPTEESSVYYHAPTEWIKISKKI